VSAILQIFSSVLAESCEQRGLSSELIDLASTDPEERLLEEVCNPACNIYRSNSSSFSRCTREQTPQR
jgi:hypothetical protein